MQVLEWLCLVLVWQKFRLEVCCFFVFVHLWLIVFLVTTGLFMALQPRIIACGNSIAAFAMAVRFLAGPAVMAAASIAVGLRGVLLHIAIVQVNNKLARPNHRTLYYFKWKMNKTADNEFPSQNFRQLYHKELFPLCLPRNTTCILTSWVQGLHLSLLLSAIFT